MHGKDCTVTIYGGPRVTTFYHTPNTCANTARTRAELHTSLHLLELEGGHVATQTRLQSKICCRYRNFGR